MRFGAQPMFSCTRRWDSVQANGLLTINWKRFTIAHALISAFFFDTMVTVIILKLHFHFLLHMTHFSPTPNTPEIPQFWMILVNSLETVETKKCHHWGLPPLKLSMSTFSVVREGEKKRWPFCSPPELMRFWRWCHELGIKREWRTSTSGGRRGQMTFTAGEEMLIDMYRADPEVSYTDFIYYF